MSRRLHTLVVCAAASLTIVSAQQFDAAAIHASAGLPVIHMPMLDSSMRGGQIRQGRYEVRSATLVDLIATAYRVDRDKVSGGPPWINTDIFDVIAKAPASTTPDALRLMLQALLAERFGLQVHPGTKPLPGLALTAGVHLQLKSSNGGESRCRNTAQNGAAVIAISCENVTMTDFAAQLPRLTGAWLMGNPVADMTGLQGGWNFTLKMSGRNWLKAAGSDGISLSEALEKQLGLTLDTRNIPTPVLVVDKVTRTPAPNPPDAERMLPALPTKFEAADIKPSAPGSTQRSFRSQPGGLVELRGFTLGDLIRMAWELTDLDAIDHEDLLTGAPTWPERFDIVGRAGGTERLDSDAVRTLLRTLLADRFGLRSHIQKQPATVEALMAVRPKLTRADPSSRMGCRNAPAPSGSIWTFTVVCRNTTMAQLAEDLPAFGASYIQHSVVDETGLKDGWDFTLNWTPPHLTHAGESASENDPNGGLTIPEALEKELGLKLVTKKRPMDVLVIDHVERMPTEN
ncbi:MAG TPA: TIGR03435 family protein [Bryobacteraceae bacterium]|jgi:uncharacterized protein (TIGR03435 family)